MYQRYNPRPNPYPERQGKPPSGEMGQGLRNQNQYQRTRTSVCKNSPKKEMPKKETPLSPKQKNAKDGILRWLPPALYHRETKKILGIFTAEDLLLIALILLFLENETEEDNNPVYLLVYLLISDYFDLPF